MLRSPTLRIVLAVVVLVFAWMLLAGWSSETPRARLVLGGMAALLVLFALALLAPRRMAWGFRVLAGTVFLLYAAYFVDQARQLLRGDAQPFVLGQPSTLMAGLGLLVFGIPCLVFALSGQWIPVHRALRGRNHAAPREPDDDAGRPGS
jgi:hypothetical protein